MLNIIAIDGDPVTNNPQDLASLSKAKQDALRPTLDELLEAPCPGGRGIPFWGCKPFPTIPLPFVPQTMWAIEHVYREERGDDALYYELFTTQEAALWSYWFEQLDDVYDSSKGDPSYFSSEFTPSQWLTDTLQELQDLRDDGIIDSGDCFIRLTEVKVNG